MWIYPPSNLITEPSWGGWERKTANFVEASFLCVLFRLMRIPGFSGFGSRMEKRGWDGT